jgi:hypothetical protein
MPGLGEKVIVEAGSGCSQPERKEIFLLGVKEKSTRSNETSARLRCTCDVNYDQLTIFSMALLASVHPAPLDFQIVQIDFHKTKEFGRVRPRFATLPAIS